MGLKSISQDTTGWRQPQPPGYLRLLLSDVHADSEFRSETSVTEKGTNVSGRKLVGFLAFVLAALTMLSVGIGLLVLRRGTDEGLVLQCGSTPEEARTKGCFFEPMLSSWIAPLCYFPDVAESYEDVIETWPWYNDANGQQQLTSWTDKQRLRNGDYTTVYTKNGAHDLHCLYAWRKLNFALHNNRRWIDARSFDNRHTQHCTVGIAGAVRSAYNTSVPFKAIPGGETTDWPMMYHACIPMY